MRALPLAWRARGDIRIHSSSRSSVRAPGLVGLLLAARAGPPSAPATTSSCPPTGCPPPVELEDPAGDVVEEVAVVGDRDDGAGVLLQESLEPGDRLRVLCRLLSRPDLLLLDEPTNHLDAESVGVAGADPPGVPRHRRRGHPRPLLPRQRRGVDPRARPRRGHPVGGQLLVVAGAEQKRLAQEEKSESARQRTLARELEWIRCRPRARQAKGKARLDAYEAARRRGRGRRRRERAAGDLHPARAAARRPGGGGRAPPRATATAC